MINATVQNSLLCYRRDCSRLEQCPPASANMTYSRTANIEELDSDKVSQDFATLIVSAVIHIWHLYDQTRPQEAHLLLQRISVAGLS